MVAGKGQEGPVPQVKGVGDKAYTYRGSRGEEPVGGRMWAGKNKYGSARTGRNSGEHAQFVTAVGQQDGGED